MTCVRALISSKFGQIRSGTTELAGERTGLVVRALDSGSGDPGSILGQVGVLFP